MRTLSLSLLSETVVNRRKAMKLTQKKLAEMTGINRPLLSNLENGQYTPSIRQLEALASALGFDLTEMFVEQSGKAVTVDGTYQIAVAGVGYVGLSLAVLLSQNHAVTAVCTKPEKADIINAYQSPIQDDYIEKFFAEAKEGKRSLSLSATTDGDKAYSNADFIIIAVPTNYDPKTNYFDCSAVESVLRQIKTCTSSRESKPTIVIKSTIPVGYTLHIREKLGMDNILFSPEFLRESKALYDNLYPSRIIVGHEPGNEDAAHVFAALLQQAAVKNPIPMLFTGTTEAEATKLFVNTYLALRVSFFNELDTYAEIKGLDTASIIRASAWTPASGIITTTPPSATAATACRKTPNSSWPTIRMSLKT